MSPQMKRWLGAVARRQGVRECYSVCVCAFGSGGGRSSETRYLSRVKRLRRQRGARPEARPEVFFLSQRFHSVQPLPSRAEAGAAQVSLVVLTPACAKVADVGRRLL